MAQHVRHVGRDVGQRCGEAGFLRTVDGAPRTGERDRKAGERDELGGEGLGRCHPDLDPGIGGQQRVRLARHGALAHVDHRRGRCARLLGEAQRRQRVRGLARLRDEERHAALGQRRRAVAELGRDIDLDRDPRGLLDPVARGEAGVVGGAAGNDRHPLHPVASAKGSAGSATVSAPGL